MSFGNNMNRTVKGVSGAIYGMLVKHYKAQQERQSAKMSVAKGHGRHAALADDKPLPGYEIFYESGKQYKPLDPRESSGLPPRLTYLYNYIHNIFRRAQVEPECLIASIVYLRRFLSVSGVQLSSATYRRLVFISIVVASKTWDDVSCTTRSFFRVNEIGLSLHDLCVMEKTFLGALQYKLYLTSEDYKVAYYGMKGIWLNLCVHSSGMLSYCQSGDDKYAIDQAYAPEALFVFEQQLDDAHRA